MKSALLDWHHYLQCYLCSGQVNSSVLLHFYELLVHCRTRICREEHLKSLSVGSKKALSVNVFIGINFPSSD